MSEYPSTRDVMDYYEEQYIAERQRIENMSDPTDNTDTLPAVDPVNVIVTRVRELILFGAPAIVFSADDAESLLKWIDTLINQRDAAEKQIDAVRAAIDPVWHWFNSEEHHTRSLSEVVGDCAKELLDDRQSLLNAEAIIRKLPKTADGVPIAPGMPLWSAGTSRPGPHYTAEMREHGIVFDALYSTEAAALAARAEAQAEYDNL